MFAPPPTRTLSFRRLAVCTDISTFSNTESNFEVVSKHLVNLECRNCAPNKRSFGCPGDVGADFGSMSRVVASRPILSLLSARVIKNGALCKWGPSLLAHPRQLFCFMVMCILPKNMALSSRTNYGLKAENTYILPKNYLANRKHNILSDIIRCC